MPDLIAFCGLDCSECPAFLATKNNDNTARKKVAGEWSSNEWQLKPEDINCDGCTKGKNLLMAFCNECTVRKCALEKQVENCAHCDSFPCEKLEQPWSYDSSCKAKVRLEKIKSELI